MLRENPQQRPNIYQVIREVCLIRGTDIPIKDVSASLCPFKDTLLILPDICWPYAFGGSTEPTFTFP